MKEETKKEVAVAPKKTEITDSVLVKVNSLNSMGELKLPVDYSPENALKSAYLILNDMQVSGKPVLEVCTKESVANALLDMVVQGLSPMKKQCYFIPYGGKLTLSKSYTGTMAIAKRVAPIKSITANVVYKNDEFAYATDPLSGFKKLVSHKQVLENIDINDIRGAYAVVLFNDGESFIEPMTMKQIETSWLQGATKGNSPAHKNFRDEMCKKTAIGRACKMIINSSSDADMYRDEEIEPIDNAKEKRAEKTADSGTEEVSFTVVEPVVEEKPVENAPTTEPNAMQPNLGF
jgi:recombination protein RecT